MALGDDIRKRKHLQKEDAEHAVREEKEAAVVLRGKWLGNVARDVESSLMNHMDGHYISIPHHVPYKHGITFDEIKATAGFKALRDGCKEQNICATLFQRSSKDGFVMRVELLPETEFSKRTLSEIRYN